MQQNFSELTEKLAETLDVMGPAFRMRYSAAINSQNLEGQKDCLRLLLANVEGWTLENLDESQIKGVGWFLETKMVAERQEHRRINNNDDFSLGR